MEEMTIQEKARRYDEASKWMANVYPTLSHEQQMEAEAFFPMFQENEDEKIRQYLLKLADRCPEDSIDFMGEVKKEDVIAWLEKQGEKGTNGNEREFPYSEQKPTDDEMKELLRTEYEKGRADALAEVYCQKPERNPDQKDETLTKLIEEIDRLDEERKQNTKYKSAKSGFAHTVRYFFLSNEIKTLGELLSLGRKHVARCRNIGKMTMWAIDKALENLYGITEW